jgi:hypothetical protein
MASLRVKLPHSKGTADARSGSTAVLTVPKRHFWSTPNNGHQQTGPAGPVGANRRLMQCSNCPRYSISLSARSRNDSGIKLARNYLASVCLVAALVW